MIIPSAREDEEQLKLTRAASRMAKIKCTGLWPYHPEPALSSLISEAKIKYTENIKCWGGCRTSRLHNAGKNVK